MLFVKNLEIKRPPIIEPVHVHYPLGTNYPILPCRPQESLINHRSSIDAVNGQMNEAKTDFLSLSTQIEEKSNSQKKSSAKRRHNYRHLMGIPLKQWIVKRYLQTKGHKIRHLHEKIRRIRRQLFSTLF